MSRRSASTDTKQVFEFEKSPGKTCGKRLSIFFKYDFQGYTVFFLILLMFLNISHLTSPVMLTIFHLLQDSQSSKYTHTKNQT